MVLRYNQLRVKPLVEVDKEACSYMPFKSKQQSKACFATQGFGGKVDCKEYAKKTNYKKLPKKKKKQ